MACGCCGKKYPGTATVNPGSSGPVLSGRYRLRSVVQRRVPQPPTAPEVQQIVTPSLPSDESKNG